MTLTCFSTISIFPIAIYIYPTSSFVINAVVKPVTILQYYSKSTVMPSHLCIDIGCSSKYTKKKYLQKYSNFLTAL